MTGVEIAAGYVFAWLVRKARRVAGRADTEVDRGLDAGMDRLHDLISSRLGQDPVLERALERAQEEAAAGGEEPTERTRRRLTDALQDAAEDDSSFADAMERAVKDLKAAEARTGAVSASGDGQAIGGNVDIRADHGSAAALRMGNVSLGTPSVPGPEKG
ncbi:hypothetical protein [Streptomyces sp. NPDC127066]|uniref:hypothetical protein n=1 Tax=unclassified Streptomyces TaxID=2593676 RepID=UPI003652C4A9